MTVDKIDNIDKSRCRITLDNGDSFVLYKGELIKLHLTEGEEVDSSVISRIMDEILPKRAKLRGLNLVKNRPYTEYQLRQKYNMGGYPDAVTDIAIDYLKRMHLVDDYEYCRVFMTYKSANKSQKRMINDLMLKGVNRDTIENVMNELKDNGDMTREEELIEKLLLKKHYNRDEASYEERQKMMSYLYNKGFQIDLIRCLT